ncbi:carbohydrate ABC transporter permease [Nonomuraea sp. 10N515B]|uniref:carbohydrate ABC transporter permease n=1 Tax=Nonomuraea sp. 10N515B TaxID=3457422 RepID=UPI003FCC7FCB
MNHDRTHSPVRADIEEVTAAMAATRTNDRLRTGAGAPAQGSAPAGSPGPRRRRRLGRLALHLALIPLAAIWIYPFLWMVSAAFKSQSEMFLGGLDLLPDQVNLDNFARAWDAASFGQYMLNSVIVTFTVVLSVIVISSLAGYGLGRGDLPGKKVLVVVLVATMFIPKVSTIIPIFLVVDALGLDNSLAGVILAEAGPAHVVAILLFMGFFAGIPNELEEAALIDGAGHPRIYARIMLPLAKPVIGTVAIFNFISSWNAFLVPLVFTLTNPELRTLGVGIYAFFGEFSTDWPGLAAAAVLTILPIIVVFLWLQRFFVSGLAGAVKG